jgi:hypothetical protein
MYYYFAWWLTEELSNNYLLPQWCHHITVSSRHNHHHHQASNWQIRSSVLPGYEIDNYFLTLARHRCHVVIMHIAFVDSILKSESLHSNLY